jgi:chitodextrinase
VIPALGRLRQEDHEFKASLGYTGRPYLKNKQTNKQTNKEKVSENKGFVEQCRWWPKGERPACDQFSRPPAAWPTGS